MVGEVSGVGEEVIAGVKVAAGEDLAEDVSLVPAQLPSKNIKPEKTENPIRFNF